MMQLFVLVISTSGIFWTSVSTEKTNDTTTNHDIGLVAQIVPLVINPTENLSPPTFSAAIYNKNILVGAGAIISKNYVLTLCSLLQTAEGDKISATDIKISRPIFNKMKLKSIVNVTATNLEVHPECGGKKVHVGKDIALIKTKEAMEGLVYPELPKEDIPEGKGRLMISNFRVHNHAASDTLTAIWYIITKKVDNSICVLLFQASKEKFDDKDNYCISYFHMGDASYCQGDFGSPLSLRYLNKDILLGLNLHKHKCGQPREAASFVSVKSNLEWIQKTMES